MWPCDSRPRWANLLPEIEPLDFQDQLVVVAGGTGEVGQVVTARFVNLGARVWATFLSEAAVATFRANFPQESEQVQLERLNALDAKKVDRFVRGLVKKEGVPETLVNLIGGYNRGPAVAESTPADFAYMLDLNFNATLNFCRAVLPQMMEKGAGKIVNTAARAGLEGSALHGPYAVSKGAVIRLTETLAAEVKDRGINVNCVLPSVIDTPGNRQDQPEADFSRWVSPADLAEVILFLASSASRAIHGAAIPVYGRV